MSYFSDCHKQHTANRQDMTYIERELYNISPFPIIGGVNGQFKVKFYSDKGETKVMNLTDEQFRTVEQVLSGIPLIHCFDCNSQY